MKRGGPLRRGSKIRPRRLVGRGEVTDRQLDDACRAVVFARDGYRCTICGTDKNLQWSHLRSRRYKATRWNPQNSMTHCSGCHKFKWHEPPPGFDPLAWHRERFPGFLEVVDAALLFRGPKKKLDRTALLLWLKQELGRYRHD